MLRGLPHPARPQRVRLRGWRGSCQLVLRASVKPGAWREGGEMPGPPALPVGEAWGVDGFPTSQASGPLPVMGRQKHLPPLGLLGQGNDTTQGTHPAWPAWVVSASKRPCGPALWSQQSCCGRLRAAAGARSTQAGHPQEGGLQHRHYPAGALTRGPALRFLRAPSERTPPSSSPSSAVSVAESPCS